MTGCLKFTQRLPESFFNVKFQNAFAPQHTGLATTAATPTEMLPADFAITTETTFTG